ncbi:hypothetical protein Ciccas_000397 [Cichlidogyrus casuarinus]|uniref:RING-type E3 ubiquitin transferase n=1 Tax=Cichlidogyrus casuarinus TaxID=1844966 RepID=A0ABD2QN10_9PLAT
MDLKCYICMNILQSPIRLPCQHVFCYDCILNAFDNANVECPLCRYRLLSWKRREKNLLKYLDRKVIAEIERRLPKFIERREKNPTENLTLEEEAMLDEENASTDGKSVSSKISKRGEIHQEYEELMKREKRNIDQENKENEILDNELATHLMYEDNLSLEDQWRIYKSCAQNAEPTVNLTEFDPFIPGSEEK